MHGLMQDQPLLISSLITYADHFHGATEMVSRTIEGPIHRATRCAMRIAAPSGSPTR